MAQFLSSEIRTNLSSTCSEIKQTKEKDKELYTTFPTINFTPRFSRKVNIAKKIVRKFKKYLKSRQSSIKYPFWINFTKENYLPPFKYEEQEFKSFSHSFLRWLFSHDGGIELYQDYITEKGERLSGKYDQDYFSSLAPYLSEISEEEADSMIRTIGKFYQIMCDRREHYDK